LWFYNNVFNETVLILFLFFYLQYIYTFKYKNIVFFKENASLSTLDDDNKQNFYRGSPFWPSIIRLDLIIAQDAKKF